MRAKIVNPIVQATFDVLEEVLGTDISRRRLSKHDKTLSSEALIQFVGERIARFKKPQYVEFVTELPLKEDGGIDRQKVKELYDNG